MIKHLRRALYGETVRLFSTRLPLVTIIVALGCGFGLTGLISVIGPENSTPPLPGLDTAEGVSAVLGLLGVTLFAPALIGTTAITSEYRHQTVGTTFLAIPRRGLVLAAKLIVFAALGLTYGLIMATSGISGILVGAAIHGVTPGVPLAFMINIGLRYAVAAAIYMILGVAIGALARNQLLAIGIALGYFYLIDNLLLIVPGVNIVHPFLPGGATAALTGSTVLSDALASQTGVATPLALPAALAAIVLLTYALAAAAVSTAVSLRRDLV
jgi:ABC-2 type transport system permease protein